MPAVPDEDNKKTNIDDIKDYNDYEPVSNFEIDFKNVCQITKTKPWLLRKNSDFKKFQFPIPQNQYNIKKNNNKTEISSNTFTKSNILIKDDDINNANNFFKRNMDPFIDKRNENYYKSGILDNKSDILDNNNNNNYYSYQQNTLNDKNNKSEGNTSRQEPRDGIKSGSLYNNKDLLNNMMNFNNNNILNSNSLLVNDNNLSVNNNQSTYTNNNMFNYNNMSNILNSESDNSYVSHFRYTPTINLNIASKANEEEADKITKIKIRGWKLNFNIMKALTISVNACSTITDITFWNCGLTSELVQEFINIITPESQIKTLTLDQNPLKSSDELYSQLIRHDSPIKFLSLRSNNISNKGAIAIGESLKNNKNLALLNLWNNKIGKEGAEAIAEGLKINQTLVGLSLSRNIIKDDGAMAIAKIFSNVLLPREEQLARKKTQIELEKQKREPEEDSGTKKGGKGKPPLNHQSKTPLPNKDIRQKDVSQNDIKKKIAKVTKKDDKQKKTPDDKANSNVKDKKAGQDDKNKKGDNKKGGGNSKLSNKKGKSDDMKDSSEDGDSSSLNTDHMFEINGQGYILGNRTLNVLNLSTNELTDKSLNYFYNSLMEQEATLVNIPDDLPGLIKIDFSDNNFVLSNPKLEQINQILNNRNPFIPHEQETFMSNMELRENTYDFTKNASDFNNLNDN
ncbi:RNI-like protein [Anaeromyces robustus]|uniref:RNI-like protein n=1 Tax=Anaeromyces robustus TaxID=1754192 RepID=A0A1Y1XCQ8_9FUNG|nr:RNI-like protein [Anaeromyces robustus]|eukprot:ORX83550.1 RNI-like protein [Anaeromyces robustus]